MTHELLWRPMVAVVGLVVGDAGESVEGAFKAMTLWLARGVEAVAAVLIGLAAIEAAVRAVPLFFRGFRPDRPAGQAAWHDPKEDVRLRLGRWLAVALEFELAADVLRTAVAPTWNEIGQLAAIVVLRTVLNYFLQQEIDKAEGRGKKPEPGISKQESVV